MKHPMHNSGGPGRFAGLAAVLAAVVHVAGAAGASVEPAVEARGAGAFDAGNPRVEAELFVDASELRPGQRVRIGVLFELDPHWHIYWRNAGESGLPTELEYTAGSGIAGTTVGPIRWPAPEVFQESDGFLTTYGYEDQVLLASESVVAPSASGVGKITVVADFVTCYIGCIPGKITLSRDLPVTVAGLAAPATVSALFDEWEGRLPTRAEDIGVRVDATHSQSAVRPGDTFQTALALHCEEPACAGLRLQAGARHEAFLPEAIEGVEFSAVAHDDSAEPGFAIVLSGRASPDEPGQLSQRLAGLVPVSMDSGRVAHISVETSLPRAAAEAMVIDMPSPLWTLTGGFAPPEPAGLGLLAAIGLALLGGLILNLMPCVLPVLAIKIFHIAELAHESRRIVLGHGAAYTGGVLASMAALAAMVVGLRFAGTAVGWGFQFQEPLFVAAICTLLVVFALNLFGVFEVTFQSAAVAKLGTEATGTRRSFFEGLLAVVLATPCTAPFLGTAVGFAFASSPAVIFGIFLAIGVGLAAPYALVTLVPGWARVVPRPGAWMVQVRKALGFSLVATVVWLLWVVGRSVGIDAQALLLGYLVAVAFGVWVFGSLQQSDRRGLGVGVGAIVGAGIVLGLAALPLDPRAVVPDTSPVDEPASAEQVVWRPYDLAHIGAELQRGRPVLVDFTADWCITCKVNESVVLDHARVKAEFARLNVATFKADWTLYDEDIRQVLASHGKAGVPMYLVYGPGAPATPEVLPELLTVDIVIEALRSAAGAPSGTTALEAPRPEPEAPSRRRT